MKIRISFFKFLNLLTSCVKNLERFCVLLIDSKYNQVLSITKKKESEVVYSEHLQVFCVSNTHLPCRRHMLLY